MEADIVKALSAIAVTGSVEPDKNIPGRNGRHGIRGMLRHSIFQDGVLFLTDQFIDLFSGNCRRSHPGGQRFRHKHHSTHNSVFLSESFSVKISIEVFDVEPELLLKMDLLFRSQGKMTRLAFRIVLVSVMRLLSNLHSGVATSFEEKYLTQAMYRPFFKQHLYRGDLMIHRRGQWDMIFPTPQTKNLVICVPGVGVTKEFSVFITDIIPDLELIGKSQCFPLYYFEEVQTDELNLYDHAESQFIRHDGVTDFALSRARELNPKITREDVFYYVYGFLHNQSYRKRFSSDLKKSLPHIPFPNGYPVFKEYCKAGRDLAALHLNYETGPFCKTVIVSGSERGEYHVQKMRFISKDDKRTIIFNEFIKIENIPLVAYDYVINGKSAIEWVMERYAVTTNADSGILNDPNQWSPNQRYILELLLRVIQMSIDTMQIVSKLPEMNFPG